VAGITSPTTGSVVVNGQIVPLFELGTGFHGDLTGRENLYYFTILQNFGKQKSAEIIEKAVEFAELGDFIDQPIRNYSRGMRSRLAFSISIFIEADILAIDEVLAVGDAAFKEKSYQKFNELITSGKTILLVTHSEKEVEKVCSRCIMLGNGKLLMDGNPADVIKEYQAMNRALNKGKMDVKAVPKPY
jgi:ABC-type polysaccharide/polyol phosphate transport system ATPase subunit